LTACVAYPTEVVPNGLKLSTIDPVDVVTMVSGLLDDPDEPGDELPQAAIPNARAAAAATLPAILRFIAFRLQRCPAGCVPA
jgi:hypothetical protein